MKPDSQLQEDVVHELTWDARVASTAIGVTVRRGVVTLTGRVDSYATRAAAAEAAHRVAGVLDVANDLEVVLGPGAERTDTELAHAVRKALEWDVFVPDRLIASTVSGGVVRLLGRVEAPAAREDAARAVRNLAGVRAVINDVEVHAPPIAAADVANAIGQALERRAHRAAARIGLAVDGAQVTLEGTVRSWAERHAAVSAAWGTRGVASVVDHLQVVP